MIPTRVVADEREKASGVPDELSKLNVRVYFSTLPVADYVLNPELAIERKSVRDLVSSIYDSRLFYQASKLSAAYAKPFLLVEGDSKEVESLTKNLKSFYGAIANVSLAYGLRVLYTANPRETAMAIAELLAHARASPLARMPAEVPPKSKSVHQQQLYLVSSLPGVGRKIAERLLSKYGTPRKVMGLTAGELAMTAGIGWKKAEKIKETLDATFTKRQETGKQERLEA
ncbi:MAG: heavy metal resistance protein CzcA [Nitrososphaerota archaeon]|nr:heavy metal resistance protein CzcA [Nitrososphaerota archaeon]MDG7023797.1 heavy metal resistance protein CzcA [Nitrososphaerota archaeon]